MLVDPEIEVVVTLDTATGERRLHLVSNQCGGNTAAELWWEIGSEHFVLIHLDEYYDEALRSRRQAGLMYSPREGRRRMVLAGEVWGVVNARASDMEIARTPLRPRRFQRP